MANTKQPHIVTVDGTDYEIEKLSNETKLLIDHVADLDRKLASIDFQRQQLQVGRNSFFEMLKAALVSEDKGVEDAKEVTPVQ